VITFDSGYEMMEKNLRTRPVFLYDSMCKLCTRFKNVVSFLDLDKRIWFMPIKEAEAKGLLDSLSVGERYMSSHFIINGKIFSKGDSIVELTRYLRLGKLLAPLIFSTPSGIGLIRQAYSFFQKLHQTSSCSTECYVN
jgi:predicted DCC family thiol-disulfide oxidoreductase YuxK